MVAPILSENMQLLGHGGAGSEPAEPAARTTVLERAAESGATHAAPVDAVEAFAELTGSTAGVTVVDARGTLGSAFNSAAMQTARASR